LGPPNISETTIVTKLKLKSQLGGVQGYRTLYWNFRSTCCYLGTIRGGMLNFKLEIAIVRYPKPPNSINFTILFTYFIVTHRNAR